MDLRKYPYLIEAEVVGEFTAVYWATTIETLHMAYDTRATLSRRIARQQPATSASRRTRDLPERVR